MNSLSGFIILLLLSLVSSSPCHFPAIFNFGDSNSDTGGISAAFGPLPRPNGRTFFRTPAGRYSDGRLIVDFMAESLGLPYLSAYLDSVGTNFTHGANFATAASTIIPVSDRNISQGISPFHLGVQLSQFLKFKAQSHYVYNKVGGVFRDLLPRKSCFSEALYTIDIGQNDLTNALKSNKTVAEIMPEAMGVVTGVVKGIYEKGGRNFWIHSTGPLGCLPYVVVRGPLKPEQFDHVGCGIPYNEQAKQFNKGLKETVVRLRKDLPLAAITYVDIYSARYSLFAQAKKLGFEYPHRACCGHGGGEYNYEEHVRCGAMGEVNGTYVRVGNSCRNPMKRIIWDGIHYTEAANKWVFGQISKGKFSDPAVPFSMACRKQAL